MKAEKPQTPDDIELVPNAWDRFTRAVKQLVPHKAGRASDRVRQSAQA